MSKRAKSASAEKRKKQKKARKEAQKAQYKAYAAAGQNSKSKRVKIKATRTRVLRTIEHPNGDCGNVGCRRCFPDAGKKFRKNGVNKKVFLKILRGE